jgi:hypothetical protein
VPHGPTTTIHGISPSPPTATTSPPTTAAAARGT